jgi:hypothetical protein
MALVLRLPQMQRGFGRDEISSAVLLKDAGSFWQVLSEPNDLNNHIGYSLSAGLSQALFGRSEWTLRLPALILGILGLYALWLLTRDILSSKLALIPPLLLCLSPVHIACSTTGRGYSGMIFFTIVATYLYLRILRSPNRRDATLYVLANVLGIYFHLYAGFVTLVQGMCWLYRLNVKHAVSAFVHRRIWPELRLYITCFAAILLLSEILYLPALRGIAAHVIYEGRGSFQPRLPWDLIALFSGTDWPPLVLVVLAVSVAGMLTCRQYQPNLAHYCVWLVVLPFALMWLARPVYLFTRFFLYWLPYYLIFLTIGYAQAWRVACTSRSEWKKYLRCASVVCVSVLVLVGWAVHWGEWPAEWMAPGYREASMAILRDADETIGLCVTGEDVDAWKYYIPDRPLFQPASIAELLDFSRSYAEVRCVATWPDAEWQDAVQIELARFLTDHGVRVKVKMRDVFFWKPAD